MGYLTSEHISSSIDVLVSTGHPCLVPILAIALDSRNGTERTITAAQREVLDSIFRVDGSDTHEWYLPLGAARGASTSEGRWRGSGANYIGRSLQVMAKALRDLGVYSPQGNTHSLATDAGPKICTFLQNKQPSINTPIPIWPIVVWRNWSSDISSLDQAVEDFWQEFDLDRLDPVFERGEAPNLPLSESTLTTEQLIELLEARPTDTDSGGEQAETEAGVATFLGAKLNADGQENVGGLPVQLLLHGCPGSGKSYRLDSHSKNAHYTFRTVVHPETRYADFVGGLRPITIWKVEDPSPQFIGLPYAATGDPRVVYQFVPGPLLRAYYLACFEPNRSVVLIIEELSRGNPAQIFGDTLQLLDRLESEDGEIPVGASAYPIDPRPDVQAWLIENDITFAEDVDPIGKMRFPPNLYLWATMNRADQNARQLDAAFLRRWARENCSWKQSGCSWDDTEIPYGGATVKWGVLRSTINQKLVDAGGLPEDKFIGPYFIPKSRLAHPEYLFEDLWGYLWHDVLKARATDFFGIATMADLEEQWNGGAGSPIGPIDDVA